MTLKKLLRAGLLGFATATAAVGVSNAQVLEVLNGAASGMLNVSTNRAVIVESQEPFAELSIANPGIADISTLSDRTIYILGKAPGRTTLTLLAPDGRLITNVDVQVSPDTAEFKERLEQIIPGEAIEVRTANDGIVLSGSVSSIARLDRALDLAERYAPGRVSNLMTVGGTHQVQLQVRFAEVSRTVSKGLNLGAGLVDANTLDGGGSGMLSTAGNQNAIATGTGLTIAESAFGVAAAEFALGGLNGLLMIEALENKGLARTLAEPNLVTLSGQQANFLAGGEIPVPAVDGDGTVSIEYKPFGIELQFTPRVVDGDLINLEVATAVSEVSDVLTTEQNGFIIQGFERRETNTTVEMRDGESFAIAGLLQDDFGDQISQVPWLGDLPILGSLFRSTQYSRNQTELVIIITPHLVTPTRGEALILPTDRVTIPTESSLFLNGNLAGLGSGSGAAGEVAKQDFSGSYGYVME